MILHLPLSVYIGKKKFNLNLNQYRNAHYHVLSKAKKAFSKEVYLQIKGLEPLKPPVAVSYVIYHPGGRRFDIANIACVVDKFALDALVDGGLLPDDDFKNVQLITYRLGGFDKLNPRCELEISTIENSSK